MRGIIQVTVIVSLMGKRKYQQRFDAAVLSPLQIPKPDISRLGLPTSSFSNKVIRIHGTVEHTRDGPFPDSMLPCCRRWRRCFLLPARFSFSEKVRLASSSW